MCRSAVLSLPNTPKHSLPILIIKVFSELWKEKFIEHAQIGNSVYILFEKVRSTNQTVATKCCPDRQVYTRIAPFIIKCRWVSFRCILSNILRVDFTIHHKRCLVSNKKTIQNVFAPTAFVKSYGEAQSTCEVAWQQLVSHMHSVWVPFYFKPCYPVKACTGNWNGVATSTHVRILLEQISDIVNIFCSSNGFSSARICLY